MVVWRSAFLICLAFSLAALVQRGSGDSDLRLEDALKETSSVKREWNHGTTTTKRPGTTRAPAKPADDDFNLADALDDRNDRDDGRRKPSGGGGGGDGRYGSDDSESGVSAEASTIAGVASALAMALIGAVSSYISYQQKKFCFSIQQGLNADYVKRENLEAVVCEEPQVKYLTLQTQAAEPPPPEAPRI
ncbi:CD99 antigen-like protein 2 isoform X2 [Neomonachus schauinslandi]|uniref:CD99 antigen-like protein 2 n=1 Tax=Neomonachus schauinslandi TaxID=29088 RepID=A0A8M1M956_NEOSC|nr:CD99 antigen-like protein 2 isoform X2 [Neomonachus schauinslandi]